MALIKCPECGREISSNAANCPHCGNPVPKKMCSVHIQRASTFIGSGITCYVYIDGNMIGELKNGSSLDTQLPVGTHTINTESVVRGFGYNPAETMAKSGEQFTIKDSTRSVSVFITAKGSWTGTAGRCIIESVTCR